MAIEQSLTKLTEAFEDFALQQAAPKLAEQRPNTGTGA